MTLETKDTCDDDNDNDNDDINDDIGVKNDKLEIRVLNLHIKEATGTVFFFFFR